MKSETERGRRRRHATKALERLKLLSVAWAFGVLSTFSQASVSNADVISISYNGTVASVSGTDPGFFGGGNIVGDAFSALFEFVVPCPNCFTNSAEAVSGGFLQASTASPLLFASLTINGHTASFPPLFFSGARSTASNPNSFKLSPEGVQIPFPPLVSMSSV
jgi:hypothetical protein